MPKEEVIIKLHFRQKRRSSILGIKTERSVFFKNISRNAVQRKSNQGNYQLHRQMF